MIPKPDRSPESVERLFVAIRLALAQCPDLRVAQLIVNVCGDPYYVENDTLTTSMREFAEERR